MSERLPNIVAIGWIGVFFFPLPVGVAAYFLPSIVPFITPSFIVYGAILLPLTMVVTARDVRKRQDNAKTTIRNYLSGKHEP